MTEETKMYDVIAVDMTTHRVRLVAENKTEKNAMAIEHLALLRNGCDEEFFETVPTGKYKDGEEWSDQ